MKKNSLKHRLNIPGQREFDVVGLGLNAYDYLCVIRGFPRPGDKFQMKSLHFAPGGQVATALCCLARLGFKTRYIGKFGDDLAGKASMESLQKEGIDLEYSKIIPGTNNQQAFIMVDDETGERTIIWNRPSSLKWEPGEIPISPLVMGRVLLLDGHDIGACIKSAKHAKANGIPVVLDAETVEEGTRDLVALSDVVIGDKKFLELFSGEKDVEKGLLILAESGPNFAAVTMGDKGALGYYNGNFFRSRGFNVKVIDTTGAGDAFHGAFIAGMLYGWDADLVMKFADAVAALSCRGMGGRSSLPDREEVLEFLKRNGINP
ncbi:MAG: ribokinase [Candidatus Eremiobacteraeota bacterium]|nr:ribokinase [Candidatus Eremiobacteraeota bacterium]